MKIIKLYGAMTVEFTNRPNDRVMFITALGGNGIVNDETFSQVEDHGLNCKVQQKQVHGHKKHKQGYIKLKANFNTVRYVVEKDL
jgi:hypothetical protein